MAAAAADYDQYIRTVLNINPAPVRQALANQGLANFDSFIGLEEEDIESIATIIRKPGGTVRRDGEVVNNPGTEVAWLAVKRLEYLRFYVNHCSRIQRPLIVQEMTIQRLQNVYKIKETIDALKKETIELPGKITKVDDIRNNIEDLDDYLLRKRGESGLPLAYVVRENVEIPANAPEFGLPTSLEEMVARGDHDLPAYQTDNIEVWNVIRHMTHGGLAWSWVSGYNRNKNGRDAYIALKAHYLGESYQNRIKATADATLQKTYYDGQRSFTFEQYISTLQKAFTDLESCGEAVAEERKVRVLLRGITATSLQTGVGIVMANPMMKTNYEMAVNYLAETNDGLKQAASVKRNVSVAKTTPKKGDSAKKNKKTPAKKKQTFYTKKDWWNLTEEQRTEIRNKRKAQATSGTQAIQTVVTGTVTDISDTPTTTSTLSTEPQSIGAVMSRRRLN